MKNISKLVLGASLLFVAAAAIVLIPANVSAQEEAQTVAAETKKDDTKKTETKTEDAYKYTAYAGDSYSLMARKATQDYNSKNKSGLSQAQILYVETNLTQVAGSPSLAIGQQVTIKKSDVKSWVDKAKKLTDAQKAAWNEYVSGANFDTSSVGA